MADDDTSSNSDSNESEFSDTDEELQDAFAKKSLQPGLHVLAPFVKRKTPVNNVTGLQNKLDAFKLNLEWPERLDIVNDLAPVAPELSTFLEMGNNDKNSGTHDDFKKEILLYRQAQAAVLETIPKLHALGIPTKRPEDYFAQMAKSDEHMQKVRQTLIGKQEMLERREKARKIRELRKYGKQVQVDTIQRRNREKKKILESVKKLRKGQLTNLDFLNDDKSKKPSSGSSNKQNKKGQKKKKFKEQKYGYGGQKKRSKYNDANSSAEVAGFKRNLHQPKTFGKQKVKGKDQSKNGRQRGSKKK